MIQINSQDDFCTILYVWKCRSFKHTRIAKNISNVSFQLSWKSYHSILPRKLNKLTQRCKKKTSYTFLSLCYDLFAKTFDCFYFLTSLSKNKNEVLFIFNDFNIHVYYRYILINSKISFGEEMLKRFVGAESC